MTPLEQAINTALIKLVSERVVERLTAQKQSALVVFDGSIHGLNDAHESVEALREAGWKLDLFCAKEACGQSHKTCAGCKSTAATDLTGADIQKRLDGCGVVVAASMAVSLAAKVTMGIADDPVSRLLTTALELGKPIVAARDGCCPTCRGREDRGFGANSAYRAMMVSHLTTLVNYGVKLCDATNLAQAVMGIIPSERQTTSNSLVSQAPARVNAPSQTGKRVIGWSDAKRFKGQALHLDHNQLITPLAAEELRARNIRIIKG